MQKLSAANKELRKKNVRYTHETYAHLSSCKWTEKVPQSQN